MLVKTSIIGLSVPGLAAALIALWQADLIPSSVWEQIPIVVLFCGVFILMVRYHLQEQDKWRQMVHQERMDAQQTFERSSKDQREAQIGLLQLMLEASQSTFKAFSDVQAEAFEEAIERVAGQYYRLGQDLEQRGNDREGTNRR